MANQKNDDNQNKLKIGISVVALAAAALIMAYYLGAFDKDPKAIAAEPEPLTQEQKVERKKAVEKEEEYRKTQPKVPPSGS